MKQLCKQMAVVAGLLFILTACGESNSNYPKDFIGFDKATRNYAYDKSKDSEEFDVKIIAADKEDRDRVVLITGIDMPGKGNIFSVQEKRIIIPAKKKAAYVHVTIYPKRIKGKGEFRLVCTPQEKDAKKTQITIMLESR